ncbi:MAG: hypothetical protein Q8Q33_08960 [Chlamydiota bacterium]|nr:hypothetical protein [Chlamydiota bacterium]
MKNIVEVLLCLFSGLVTSALYSFICAEIGFFSWIGSSIFFFVSSFSYYYASKKLKFITIKINIKISDVILLFLLCTASIFFYFPPSEYILGGWDPGVYLITGINIVKHGAINFSDALLSHFNSIDKEIFLSRGFGLTELYPAMRVAHETVVLPQFSHMYPVLLGWVYGLMGIKGSMALNSIIGIISIPAIYLLCRLFTNARIALIGPLLLFLNPLQIWMVRFQNSEMLTQLGFILGFYFLFASSRNISGNWTSQEIKKWAYITHILSALCLWISLLARYDFLLVIVPLYAFTICTISMKDNFSSSRNAKLLWLILITLSFIHMIVHQNVIATLYKPLSRIFVPASLSVIIFSIMIAVIIYFMGSKLLNIWHKIENFTRWLIALSIITIFIYAVFFRVNHIELGWERFNVLNLATFLTWPVMILALIGICGTILFSKRYEQQFFILLGTSITILICINKHIDPFYLWGARRFIPVVIPFLIVSSVIGIYYLNKMFQNSKIFVFVIIFIVGSNIMLTHRSRSELVGYRDYQGITDFFKNLSTKLPETDLLITQERGIAEILHYYYDVPAVYLRNPNPEKLAKLEETIKQRLQSGQNILILTQNRSIYEGLKGLEFESLNTFSWNGLCLNHSRNGFPKGSMKRGFDLMLLKPSLVE